jgi:FAD/FMN-containing dehydrogenase
MSALPSHRTATSTSELQAALNGRVVTPDDAAYDRARTVFYGGDDRRPAAVVRPADAKEVAQVVLFAREHGLELAVRSGGHSLAGHGVSDGGIVLDLGGMKAWTSTQRSAPPGPRRG